MGLLIPLICFFIAFGSLWQAYRDPQVPLPALSQNATALVFFAVFIGLGFLLVEQMSLSSHGGNDFYLIMGFCFCWAALSLLWVIRKIPRDSDSEAPVTYVVKEDAILETDDASLCEMQVMRPWYLEPFDYVDRCLLKIAGLCLLIEIL